MEFRFARVRRRPAWPLAAVLVALLWAALATAVLFVSHRTEQHVTLCLFKRLTGVPCPTCGCTRGLLHLWHGQPLQAWLCNPLMACLAVAALLVLFLRVALGRAASLRLTSRERVLAWCAAGTLLLANWIYIIFAVG